MTLRERQIKALKETLSHLKKEYKEIPYGYRIDWTDSRFRPLCLEFTMHCQRALKYCTGCPFEQFESNPEFKYSKFAGDPFMARELGCLCFLVREFKGRITSVPILASIIYQIILYFEEE